MKHIYLTILTIFVAVASLPAREISDTTELVFHQSKWDIDTTIAGNGRTLEEIRSKINYSLLTDSGRRVSRIRVEGAASPEGSIAFNEFLSRKRAEAIFSYFKASSEIPDSVTEFRFIGRDWKGLYRLAEKDEKLPDRQLTLSVIKGIGEHPSGLDRQDVDRLKRIGGGIPYRYMYANLFPQLRSSTLIVEYSVSEGRTLIPVPDGFDPYLPTSATIENPRIGDIYMSTSKSCRPFYMSLRTNLLYDALLLPNIGAEFYIGKNWSVNADWMYGWWDNDNRHRYWRAYGGTLGVNRWFGHKAEEKPLTGHHVGIFAGVITYDFEFGGKGYMGGKPGGTLWERCNFIGGIEYGYSLPIARRLNLDFTLGVGYLGGKYYEYIPKNGHYYWQATKRLNWVGPTKAEISLVWLIGCDNYNKRK